MRLYRGAVALVLGVTALLKFFALARHEPLLAQPDPLTGFSLFWLTLLAGTVETALALFLLFCARPQLALIVTHITALGFVGYHVAVNGSNSICPCLGGGVTWWPWLGKHQNEASTAIALWLWTSTSVLLLPSLRQKIDP